MNTFRVIGLMSGTSLDGLDLAACTFVEDQGRWHYEILFATTVPYPPAWEKALKEAHTYSGLELSKLHKDYGHYLGLTVKRLMSETGFRPDLIASHGHTVFHQPEQGLTFQMGDGAALAAVSGIAVACDFRTGDVALGGQGAPLVPAGDKLLFGDFTACLNLGGFSNISYDLDNRRIAHDICPCNMALNRMALLAGQAYDADGLLAGKGHIDENLLDRLNKLEFYSWPAPKSLGREWFEETFLPLLDTVAHTPEDLLATLTEHIAIQIARSVSFLSGGSLLITGGGAHNQFLTQRIKSRVSLNVEIPGQVVLDYKEALIFAFLGMLRYKKRVNVLASVTGASHDHIAGALYL